MLLTALCTAGPAQAAHLAWLRDGQVTMLDLGGNETLPAKLPLGSLWKLLVFVYLAETERPAPAYLCLAKAGRDSGDEDQYCCDPGDTVERDSALANSCAPFFAPARLQIDAAAWRQFWQGRGGPAWLSDLQQIRPETQATPADILAALAAVPVKARRQAEQALLAVVLRGAGRPALADLGGRLRVKTFTWGHPQQGAGYFGGAAGWLADGSPLWFGGKGGSRAVFARWGEVVAARLPALQPDSSEDTCVVVDFFSKYPLRRVLRADGGDWPAGPLQGTAKLEFANGQSLQIESRGEMELTRGRRLQLTARLGLTEYVARVIDREGDARQTEAARALGILARSYLLQEGQFAAGCYHIADASRTQRVAPRPASAAALAAAGFTRDLLLLGTPIRYHRDRGGEGRLNWQASVDAGRQGQRFPDLLAQAFPHGNLGAGQGVRECRRLQDAEAWLAGASRKWAPRLAGQAGYEKPERFAVCRLEQGNPYADQNSGRIYVRHWTSRQDRITLAHEYLHLAFRYHPRGLDEDWVESTARRLIDEY